MLRLRKPLPISPYTRFGSDSCKTADTITVYVIPDFSIQATDTTICKAEIQIPLQVQSSTVVLGLANGLPIQGL
ncbi:MAG: hypothetical protein R2831_02940 [Chitinophagaceae bacterium]